MGGLTTHALNTATGQPAANLRIDLSVREGAQWRLLKSVQTNAQGRTAVPLLSVEVGLSVAAWYRWLR